MLRLPLVILATMATVIASQAMISGAYSIARQCMQIGFLPRLTVRHTSQTEEGQIYLPQVNSAILVGVLVLVLSFRTCDTLAAAYGIAVTGTFLCTSCLAMVVFRRQFRLVADAGDRACSASSCWSTACSSPSNLLKVPEGGWVPLVLGAALIALMTSWKRGRELMLARWKQDSLPLELLPQAPAAVAHAARAGHRGVPDRQPGLRADLAAAQPEAQQGAARAGPLRHRPERWTCRRRPRRRAARSRSWRRACTG